MMVLEKLDGIELPAAADLHVHLREGEMTKLVTPMIRDGGVNTVFVMPNLIPPVTSVQRALDYHKTLQSIEPNVKFLMSLYLHPDITPEVVREAKKTGVIYGIKSYPHGVTTNSGSGVVSYEQFYPVFEEMERQDLVLNLHGEVPSGDQDVTIMNAEEAFLPTLLDLHSRFPKLRIVLEHCTSAAAIEAVKKCGPTVVATLTAHHLFLTVDDWAGDPHCFCKPVAKLPSDRRALLRTAVSGNSKFFFGTDSAPHPAISKRGDKVAAGVFTQPHSVAYVIDALQLGIESGVLEEEDVTAKKLEDFFSTFGRAFYRVPDERKERIVLRKPTKQVEDLLTTADGKIEVVPFRRGKLTWDVRWK